MNLQLKAPIFLQTLQHAWIKINAEPLRRKWKSPLTFYLSEQYLKSCEWKTRPGKEPIPGKLGTFGVLKWPEATMTWSKTSTNFSTLALTSVTWTLNFLQFSSNSTLLTAWPNVTDLITLCLFHLAAMQGKTCSDRRDCVYILWACNATLPENSIWAGFAVF